MLRFLVPRTVRRVGEIYFANKALIGTACRNHGALSEVGLPSYLYRFYKSHRLGYQGSFAYSQYRSKGMISGSSYIKKLYGPISSKLMAYHTQLAWKRLFQIYSYRAPAFPTISKMACAVSLACTRSQLVPSIFALIISEMAWTRKAWADSEYFPVKDTLYTRAQNGHIHLTSFISSLFEGLILLLRVIYLSILFSPTIAMAPFVDYFGPQFRKTWLRLVHFTLEKAGPAFIKWGQWAATRPDLFPGDLCAELAKLHTQAPAHSFEYSKKTIEKAFGRKLSEIFENFEEEPLASGSIAQVHRASLKYRYPGQQIKPITVAVKVRHPHVGESIRRDFTILDMIAKVSNFIPALEWLRLDESLQQFAVFMMSQVDLAREAAHLSRFIYNFRSWKNVSFPKPVYPLVHPAVLVESYEQGECVSHYVDELEGNARLKSSLAHIGTHALLKMLLVDNFIHADMHPGNILVRVSQRKLSQKNKSKPHVVFLDVGMTAELSKSDRVNLLEFFKAVAVRDGRTAAQCTLRLSKQQNCPDPAAFIEEVEKSFSFWGTPEGDIVHPAECMHQLLEQVRRHKVNIDGNVCTVMVTTLVLEGWQRKLDPSYNGCTVRQGRHAALAVRTDTHRMRMVISKFSFVLLLFVLFARECPRASASEKEAYVTLLYGDEFLLGVRVLGKSIRETGSTKDMVVLVSDGVSDYAKELLKADGWIVELISLLANPNQVRPKRFWGVYTKLKIFNMTNYKKVVYLDADTIVVKNIEDLFKCGKFCANLKHSERMNSGVMVVEPSETTFKDMMRQVGTLPSYTGGDQGFLNSYYVGFANAHVFDPNLTLEEINSKPEPEMQRLSTLYNADVGLYMLANKWMVDESELRIIHYTLGPLKPWDWWTAWLVRPVDVWQSMREQLDESLSGTGGGRNPSDQLLIKVLFLIPFCVLIFCYYKSLLQHRNWSFANFRSSICDQARHLYYKIKSAGGFATYSSVTVASSSIVNPNQQQFSTGKHLKVPAYLGAMSIFTCFISAIVSLGIAFAIVPRQVMPWTGLLLTYEWTFALFFILFGSYLRLIYEWGKAAAAHAGTSHLDASDYSSNKGHHRQTFICDSASWSYGIGMAFLAVAGPSLPFLLGITALFARLGLIVIGGLVLASFMTNASEHLSIRAFVRGLDDLDHPRARNFCSLC
ncbi:hypothetical protein H6P81_019126 [Aristolochia fimbriata]|uniref:ABC1 atypical kinase-like domain-containing protein n=1 Tax=Aristolochia fimbriata TaxID=158543 RepID=A0AAV7DTI3_ARIFI|nr:hypothetical protein H6P81_019126 [Aristolochia fimbriata]